MEIHFFERFMIAFRPFSRYLLFFLTERLESANLIGKGSINRALILL